jgi:hypothetical protein
MSKATTLLELRTHIREQFPNLKFNLKANRVITEDTITIQIPYSYNYMSDSIFTAAVNALPIGTKVAVEYVSSETLYYLKIDIKLFEDTKKLPKRDGPWKINQG